MDVDLTEITFLVAVGLGIFVVYEIYKNSLPSKIATAAQNAYTSFTQSVGGLTGPAGLLTNPTADPQASGLTPLVSNVPDTSYATARYGATGGSQTITNGIGSISPAGMPYNVGVGTLNFEGQSYTLGDVVDSSGQTVQDYLNKGYNYGQIADILAGN